MSAGGCRGNVPVPSPFEFIDGFFLADSAARLLAEERPSRRGSAFLRQSPVGAIRALWRCGDPALMKTVASRVHVWLDLPKSRLATVVTRIEGKAAR